MNMCLIVTHLTTNRNFLNGVGVLFDKIWVCWMGMQWWIQNFPMVGALTLRGGGMNTQFCQMELKEFGLGGGGGAVSPHAPWIRQWNVIEKPKRTKHCYKESGRACDSEEKYVVYCLVCTDPESMALMSEAKMLLKEFLLTNHHKSTEIPLDWI